MAINPISTLDPALATPSSGRTSGSGSERDMFMTLLVAQLKNQDPLAPQEGTEFVAQLAQFNSLDQLIGIRNSIEALSSRLDQQTETGSENAGD
jgi:flagellar basal-body rod modification protein FlgD